VSWAEPFVVPLLCIPVGAFMILRRHQLIRDSRSSAERLFGKAPSLNLYYIWYWLGALAFIAIGTLATMQLVAPN
jgi:ABC-type Mn2+/Zn2+ transport system permease subunit